MGKKKKLPQKYQVWVDARKRFHLSHAHIQMAREIGLNPKKFGSLANHRQEPWKAPLADFIESLYWKRFKKDRPDVVRPIEEMVEDRKRKRVERKDPRRKDAVSELGEVKQRKTVQRKIEKGEAEGPDEIPF